MIIAAFEMCNCASSKHQMIKIPYNSWEESGDMLPSSPSSLICYFDQDQMPFINAHMIQCRVWVGTRYFINRVKPALPRPTDPALTLITNKGFYLLPLSEKKPGHLRIFCKWFLTRRLNEYSVYLFKLQCLFPTVHLSRVEGQVLVPVLMGLISVVMEAYTFIKVPGFQPLTKCIHKVHQSLCLWEIMNMMNML